MKILYLKNMVCGRCVTVVKQEFEKLEIQINRIELGKIELFEELNVEKKTILTENLQKWGFELLENKQAQWIEQVKKAVLTWLQLPDKEKQPNASDFISKYVGRDYSFLSNLFSSVEGLTIEKYIILQKIEKAKELLVYNELTLSEIAIILNYSSVQHLSAQFRKITGFTVSEFKKLQPPRQAIDQI